jgi:hypothetical protein
VGFFVMMSVIGFHPGSALKGSVNPPTSGALPLRK